MISHDNEKPNFSNLYLNNKISVQYEQAINHECHNKLVNIKNFSQGGLQEMSLIFLYLSQFRRLALGCSAHCYLVS